MAAKKQVGFQPLGPRVLVKPISEESVTASGIVLPDTVDKEKPQVGEVVVLGTGPTNKKDFQFFVKVGDKVYFKKYSPDEITIDDEDYLVMEQDDILGVMAK